MSDDQPWINPFLGACLPPGATVVATGATVAAIAAPSSEQPKPKRRGRKKEAPTDEERALKEERRRAYREAKKDRTGAGYSDADWTGEEDGPPTKMGRPKMPEGTTVRDKRRMRKLVNKTAWDMLQKMKQEATVRPGGMASRIRRLAAAEAEFALQVMVDVASDEDELGSARVTAADKILDRGIGKAKTFLDSDAACELAGLAPGAAMAKLVDLVAKGEVSHEDATALKALIESQSALGEVEQLRTQVEALQAQIERLASEQPS
jgi:hypothetical protein